MALFRGTRLSLRAKSRLYGNLAKYARSGMGMERACESMLAQPRVGRAERRVCEGLRRGLGEGRSIAEALGRSCGAVSPLERAVVAAAESGGRLEEGFGHLAGYFQRLHRTRRRVAAGLTYPVVLLHLAIPACTLAATAFQSFSLDGTEPAEVFSAALATTGRWFIALYAAGAAALLGGFALARLARRSPATDAVLGRAPLLGAARRAMALERFSRVFEIFLLSGARISTALSTAGEASGSARIGAAARRAAAAVSSGATLASTLFAAPDAFPDEFSRGVAAAEESGQLDSEMADWGRHYSEEAGVAMDRLGDWTPKLFYWAILALVAGMILRAGLAYRNLLEGLIGA